MDKLSLKLEPREVTGKQVKRLRKEGLVPASICGKGIASENFQLDAKTFGLVYRRVGRSGLIEIELPRGTQSAFVRQVQRHPVSGQFLHVDFRIVDLRTEITADVPVTSTGENALVERGDAVLTQVLQTLHVRALPSDLPQVVELDVSTLEDFHAALHVSDVKLGDKVQILTPAEEVVFSLTPSRMAVEEEEITEQEQEGEPALHGAEAEEAVEAEAEEPAAEE